MGRGSSGLSSASGGGGKVFDRHDSFFGANRKVTNKFMELEKQVIDNDHILLFTNNVASIKGNPVLVVNDNQAVYLKDFQIAGATVKDASGNTYNTYAVKVNRQYFKPYTFRSQIGDFSFDKAHDFDSLLNIAKQQQSAGNTVHPRRISVGYKSIDYI